MLQNTLNNDYHNGLYQGQFGFDKLYYLPEFDFAHVNVLEWDNCINLIGGWYKMCMGSDYSFQVI
jgi:hypothetical protein